MNSNCQNFFRRTWTGALALGVVGFFAAMTPAVTVLAQGLPVPPEAVPAQPPIAVTKLGEGADLAKLQAAAKAAVEKSAGAKFLLLILTPLSTDVDENVQTAAEVQSTGEAVTASLGKAGITADRIKVSQIPGSDVPRAEVRLYAR